MSTLWLWGRNNNGELGDETTIYKSSPVQTVGAASDWKQVSCGYRNTLAIKNDGSLWSWGYGGEGATGLNDTYDTSSPTQIGTDKNWKLIATAPIEISVSAGIKNDGTLWMWGFNGYGQLGLDDNSDRSSPTQVGSENTWSKVSCNGYFTGAIKTDGTLWTWGANGYGQLGDGTNLNRSSPLQIGAETTWKSISCGYGHMAALKTDGTIWLWGSNYDYQLGNTIAPVFSSPVQLGAGGTDWAAVKAGGYFTLAMKNDGSIWSWGSNYNGELGLGNTVQQSEPQQIGSSSNWIEISAGQYHAMARKSDKSLWLWGSNEFGQLGDGTTENKSTPTQTIADGKSWMQISAGGEHSAALYNPSMSVEIKSCVKTVCANKAGFPCHVPTSTNAANCKCATWRMFYPRCSVILQNLGRCSASAGAYVPAITVCNERLF